VSELLERPPTSFLEVARFNFGSYNRRVPAFNVLQFSHPTPPEEPMLLSPAARSLVFLVFIATGPTAFAQVRSPDNRPRNCSISGRVTVGGQPAAGAQVIASEIPQSRNGQSIALVGANAPVKTVHKVRADADGLYQFVSLPAGRYQVRVLARAFISAENDLDYELGRAITLDDGETREKLDFALVAIKGADVTRIDLKLVKYGAVSGRVVIEGLISNQGSNIAANASPLPATCESNHQIGEILVRARSERHGPRSVNLVRAENRSRASRIAPDAKGEFTIKGLEADGYRLETDLPGESWYVRSITGPAAGSAKRADAVRAPINLRPSEKLTGIEIAIAEGAAALSGRVIPAKDGGSLPPRLRVHLVPAEITAADDVLRYREATTGPKNSFEFKHLAPGKYLLLARSISENEANGDALRLAAFDPAQRAQLRREAEAAKNEIEVMPCQPVKNHALRF
jgi:hypothetical protein